MWKVCSMWNVECGMWNVECGMWNVECGMWNVECGMWNVENCCGGKIKVNPPFFLIRAYLKIRFRAERRDFYGETGGGGRGISRYVEPEPKRYSQKSRSLRAGDRKSTR